MLSVIVPDRAAAAAAEKPLHDLTATFSYQPSALMHHFIFVQHSVNENEMMHTRAFERRFCTRHRKMRELRLDGSAENVETIILAP